jgi:hypothetical protein
MNRMLARAQAQARRNRVDPPLLRRVDIFFAVAFAILIVSACIMKGIVP